MIHAFIGVIGSGKDYRATATGAVRIDFKDALLDMVTDIVGYDVRADYEWFKENPVGVMRPANPILEGMLRNEWKPVLESHPAIMTGRRLLQRLGTEGMRKRDPDYWCRAFVKRARAAILSSNEVAVADCRFPNEVAAIRAMGVPRRFTFCDYRSPRYSADLAHESERMAQLLRAVGFKDGQEIPPDFTWTNLDNSGQDKTGAG